MTRFDASNATVEVLTFKEGFLSPIAHDLRIRVATLDVEIDSDRIVAEIDLSSLYVVCAVKEGSDEPGTLSESDKAKIRKTIRDDVLHASRYPIARFEADLADLDGETLQGELELHGESRMVTARLHQTGPDLNVEVNVHQPDFGIKPYSAMMGTLKVRADVVIHVTMRDFQLPA